MAKRKPKRTSSMNSDGTVQTFSPPMTAADKIRERHAASKAAWLEVQRAEQSVESCAQSVVTLKATMAEAVISMTSASKLAETHGEIVANSARATDGERWRCAVDAEAKAEARFDQAVDNVEAAQSALKASKVRLKRAQARYESKR